MLKKKPVASIFLFALVAAPLILLITSSSAIAQVEPQQGAINTTRSNIKNTSREIPADGLPIAGVWVELRDALGSSAQTAGARVTATDKQGAFSFADVAPGEYVLTFSATKPKPQPDRARSAKELGGLGGVVSGLGDRSALDTKIDGEVARISITGAADGTIKREFAVKVRQSPSASQRTLGTRIDNVELDLGSDRLYGAGATHWGNVRLRVDGPRKLLSGHVSLIK